MLYANIETSGPKLVRIGMANSSVNFRLQRTAASGNKCKSFKGLLFLLTLYFTLFYSPVICFIYTRLSPTTVDGQS